MWGGLVKRGFTVVTNLAFDLCECVYVESSKKSVKSVKEI